MKIIHIPKSLGDVIALCIDLANENEELKRQIDRINNIENNRSKAIKSLISR